MIVSKNNEGWAFDETENWKIVHNGSILLYFGQESVSTQEILFVGSKQECEDEILNLSLKTYGY